MVYIEDLKTDDDVTILFDQCTKLVLTGQFRLGKDNTFNPGGNYKVEVFSEDKADIRKRSEVYGIIYSQENFVARKGDDDDFTKLYGMFIGEKVFS